MIIVRVGTGLHRLIAPQPAARRQPARPPASTRRYQRCPDSDINDVANQHTATTTFDTRVTARVTGSAARAASCRLGQLGYRMVAAPVSLRVSDVTGPLIGGELDRAREWGMALGAEVAARRLSRPIS
ncbi:hypothetical protein ACFT2C_09940 [Promicromonospora sp. NPDC057138]|uniref:hypothetical protein n=1 Tax=Promicromonospora sp. NPDC057138 TaxID=3346031 RepID=UPI00363FB2F3